MKLLNEQKQAKKVTKANNESLSKSSWTSEETILLQWSVFRYAMEKSKSIEEFKDEDWVNIAIFIPTRDHQKCLKRWLFI